MRMAQVQQRILLLQGRAFIQEAWREWVNRPPKMKELKYWQYQLNRGIPKHVMLQKLLRSSQVKALVKAEQPEFSGSSAVRTVHVLNQLFRQSDEEYVGGLYRELLNRNPAPEELQGFISSLVTPDDRWSVFEAITLSPEAQGLWQSRERTWSVASLLNRTFLLNGRRFVGALTRELLARGALQVEIRRFAQLALSPEGKEQVLAALLGSEAFQRALVRRRLPRGQSARGWSIEGLRKLYRLNGTDFVTGLYEELLGRTPDEGGFLLHLQKLQSLSKLDLIRGILLSQEAQLRRRELDELSLEFAETVTTESTSPYFTQTNARRVMKRPTVSAMYLVYNEEEFLPFSIRSIYDAVDEIVVVDNGSTDRTVDIVKSFSKTKLLHCSERGDFAKLRNIALREASGDWVLKLDADEVFYPDLLEKMPEMVTHPTADAYKCWFYHLIPDYWHMQNQSDFDPAYDRIFLVRNHPGLHWKNVVHESLEGIGSNIIDSRLHFVHYGYTKDVSLIAEKMRVYSALQGKPNPLANRANINDILAAVPTLPFDNHPPVIQDYVNRKRL